MSGACADSSWSPRPVPWGGVLARLRASVAVRRVVPTGPALLATDLVYQLVWRLSERRMAETAELVETVVAGTAAEADLPRLARGYVAARARGWELTWRPWELARIRVRGLDRLEHARATGRGLVVSHTHLGPLAGWVVLGGLLGPMLAPQGDWLLDPPRPGYHGYQVERWRRLYHDAGIELVHATGSGLTVYKTLKRGGTVLLALDVPGGRPTRFLGKPVDLDDGTAQLAARTDALVLPAALMPAGRRWEIQIGEPLDPRDHGTADELHLALAAVHEELIMRAPEHLESPPLWLWGRAGRDGWYRD